VSRAGEPSLTFNALKVLERRYLLKDETGRLLETPSQMFRRVAKVVSAVDKLYGKRESEVAELEEEFYQMMFNLEFLPNSPTLMNAGTEIGQLSACFVLPVEDSIPSIFEAVRQMALIHKSGGGTGFSFSRLRPKGDIVKSTEGIASGPVSFMRVFDVATDVIKQGGKRRGANMGVLRVDHPDIFEFITAKAREGFLTNFNLSVAVTDGFMEAVEKDGTFKLVNPRTKKTVRTLKAREIWNLMVAMAWKTGDPGVIFIDEINRHNPTPHVGEIEATNPCVTSDTWVMTENGPRKVAELVGQNFVAIVNGEKWKTSGGFFQTNVKRVYKLKTKEGFELRLTKDHPVLKVKRMTRHKLESEWVKAESLRPGDKIVLNNHRNLNGWNGKYSLKEGYLIGLLIGDGTLKKDKAILSSWGEGEGAKTVRSLAYAYAESLPHRSDFKGWIRVKGRTEYRMSISHLKKLAEKLGLKPGVKAITESMEKASSEFCKGLLRGLFDADGSVQGSQLKGVSVRLSQSDLEILKAVQRMLLRFGISSKIYTNRRTKRFSKLPNGKGGAKVYLCKPQHELVISNENILYFYRKIGFGDLEKKKKLEEVIGGYKRKINRERFVATVKELTPDGEKQVYDVKIPGKNAFDANGFYVHNCGEQPLLPYESCNLGSINLSKFVKDRKIDWKRLREAVRRAVHFLDNVIDANKFPLPQIEEMTKGNRKIGLGVMGFADMLIQLRIPYNSEEALAIAEKLMKFVAEEARKKSVELGKERGSFPNFTGSAWEKKGYKAMRNATVTTIAPTGTISIIAGCSSGIEPLFAVAFIRNVMEGTQLLEVNPHFEKIARDEGFYSEEMMNKVARHGSIQRLKEIPEDVKRIFVTAHDVAPEWHVRMQAVFQKYTDNAVSKTVNLPQDVTIKDVENVFWLAYRLKCKGITVYRYGSKLEQVLYIGAFEKGAPKIVRADSEYAGGCPTPYCPWS